MLRRSIRGRDGFTLLELMIVVAIIGLLATMAIPNYSRAQRGALVSRTANEMRALSDGFYGYLAGHGLFPPDSHDTLPPGMEEYINPSIWADGTPIGGNYNWEGPDVYGYAGIAIFPIDAVDPEELQKLDAILDDGDLATGMFRIGTTGKPTLMIDGF